MIGLSKRAGAKPRLVATETWLLILLALFAAFSIVVQLTAKDVSPRDLMVIIRYVVYLATLYAGIAVGLSSTKTSPLWYLSLALIGLSIAISFAQYFNIGGINSVMLPIYTEDNRYSVLEEGLSWRRIVGTMGNPNYWGFFLGLGFILSSYMCLKKRFIFLAPALLLFVSIVMTGSRTSLLAAIATMLVGALLTTVHSNKRFALKALVPLLIACLLLGTLYFSYSYFTADYYEAKDRFSTSNLNTFELRIQWWIKILNEMSLQPYTFMLGQGPNKLESVRYGDNIYILYLRDFGLIGLGLYLLLLAKIIRTLFYRTAQLASSPYLGYLAAITFLCFVQLAIFDLAADGWFNVRMAEVLLFGYGLTLGLTHKHHKRRIFYESLHSNP
jgi:hypothetical protein